MNFDVESVITGGGVTGFVCAIAYCAKLALEWRRQSRGEPRADATARITDAGTANAILSRSLHDLQSENTRLIARVQTLEADNAEKDRKLDELEDRVRTLTMQLTQVTDDLAALRSDH